MREWILLTATAAALWGANPPVISGVLIDNITHSAARVTWQTDSSSTTKVQWGLTVAYGNTKDINYQNFRAHGSFVSGLTPATTYQLRVCSTDTVEACSGNFSFTTAAEPAGHVPWPVAPAEVDTTLPTVNGVSLAVAADCSNLQTQLTAIAGQNGNLTHEVVIPAGTTCVGRYVLPAKSGANANGTGWLILRSGGTLPPENTRITPETAAPLARIITNYVAAYFFNTPPGSCELGDFWWDADDATPVLYRCTNRTGPVWTAIPPAATGSTVPATCAEGDWFYKTNEPSRHRQAWWCTETNTYRNVYFDNGGVVTDWAAVYAATSARRWRVMGLRIEALRTPPSYTAQFNQGVGDQKGSTNFCLAYTQPSNDRIVFDRVVFNGLGYPNRTHSAFCFADGSNIGIINSYFNEINRWRTANSLESTPNTIFFVHGPGPVRIENNHFQNCHGITIFHSDDSGSNTPTSANDVVIRQNSFFESAANNALDPTSLGRYYYRRHFVELKRGQRWLVEGNVFNGGWPAGNQGATVAMTPRAGFSTIPANPLGLRDVWVRNNVIMHSPQPFLLTGHNDFFNYQIETVQRIAITGNLTYKTGLSTSGGTRGWPSNLIYNGQFINLGLGLEDVIIRNNTIHGSFTACCNLAFLAHAWTDVNEGLDTANNIVTMDPAMSIFIAGGVWQGGSFQGTVALNNLWNRDGTPAWTFRNNLLHRPLGAPSDYPANNFWITNASAVAYRDAANLDFSLAMGSPYRAGGSQAGDDGGDLGASMYALRSATGDVRGVSVMGVGNTQAVFRYTTFDGKPCAVDLSPAPTFSPFQRFSDNGGGRARLVTATGLTAGTQYYWRVHCGTTVGGTFQTKALAAAGRNVTVQLRPATSFSVSDAVVDYGPTTAYGSTTAPVACSSGCSLTFPGTAGQAIYYRVRYRTAGAITIATSAGQVIIP